MVAAINRAMSIVHRTSIPRSRDRGLIEAPLGPLDHQAPLEFRDHVIAASLKLNLLQPGRIGPVCKFRDHVIAASLKQVRGG